MATKTTEDSVAEDQTPTTPAADQVTDAVDSALAEAEAAAQAEAEAKAKAAAEAKAAKAKAAEDAKAAKAAAAKAAEEAEATAQAEAEAKAKAAQEAEAAAQAKAAEDAAAAQAKAVADSLVVKVTNNGPHSFDTFTKTDLPAGATVEIKFVNPYQKAAAIRTFKQLNTLAKKDRYVIEG